MQDNSFDGILGRLSTLPDATSAGPSTIRTIGTLGVGPTSLYVVQTIRHRESGGDFIFLEHVSDGQALRLVIPPAVADVIARQRDSATSKNRSKASKATAEERAARGIRPAFLTKKRRSPMA